MCEFLSAIVLRNGDILMAPEHTDSHSDLIRHFKLPDTESHIKRFAKVEYTPRVDNKGVKRFDDVDGYTLRVDEATEPAWFDEHRNKVENQLKAAIKSMIVSDKRDFIMGGCHILVKGAVVKEAKHAKMRMSGSSVVEGMSGSSVVEVMSGSSVVKSMSGSSVVEVMSGSSVVEVMSGSSVVKSMYDSSVVKSMYDSSVVKSMYDSSVVAKYGKSSWDKPTSPKPPGTT